MVLSGWTQAQAAEKNSKVSADNGASTSGASQAASTMPEDEDDDDLQIIIPPPVSGRKRKLSDVTATSGVPSAAAKEPKIKRKAEEIDGDNDNDIVMLDDGNTAKKGEA